MKKKINMLKYSLILITLSFILGLTVNNLATMSSVNAYAPFSLLGTSELISPNDWVKESQIHVYKDRIVLDIQDASWAKFTDTNSMDPIFDAESNTIEIKPKNPDVLKVGDIISFWSKTIGTTVIHRIVEVGKDNEGVYFVTKGDNNLYKDPEKVRFEQVKGVVVGIIY